MAFNPVTPIASTARSDGRTSETRERILVMAEEQIALHGVEGFQIKTVAEAVGIRPPSVFAHFKGREDIATEVAVRIVSRLGEVVAGAIAQTEEPMAALRQGVRELARHLFENPAHVRLLLRDLAQAGAGDGFLEAGRIIAGIEHALGDLLERGRAQGVFRDIGTQPMVAMIQGAILARIAWYGFEPSGQPCLPEGLEQLQNGLEEFVVAFVRTPALDLA